MGKPQIATFEDLQVGQTASVEKQIRDEDLRAFVDLTGDANPIHTDDTFAGSTFFQGRIAHGLLTASLLSTVIGMKLPGTGAIYRSQTLEFLKPVRVGDSVTATARIESLDPARNEIRLACRIDRGDGETVVRGTAIVSLIRSR